MGRGETPPSCHTQQRGQWLTQQSLGAKRHKALGPSAHPAKLGPMAHPTAGPMAHPAKLGPKGTPAARGHRLTQQNWGRWRTRHGPGPGSWLTQQRWGQWRTRRTAAMAHPAMLGLMAHPVNRGKWLTQSQNGVVKATLYDRRDSDRMPRVYLHRVPLDRLQNPVLSPCVPPGQPPEGRAQQGTMELIGNTSLPSQIVTTDTPWFSRCIALPALRSAWPQHTACFPSVRPQQLCYFGPDLGFLAWHQVSLAYVCNVVA